MSNTNYNSNFIQDFLEYNSGTECHKNYLRWAAIATLGVAAGLRYRLNAGGLRITPNIYVMLVGGQGTRKSFAKNRSKDLIELAFPDYPIGADVTTRDDLMKWMSSDATERAYTDAEGVSDTYHPMALYINEFKHFLSYNPTMMISFIVDIYDYTDRIFRGSTIKRGQEEIKHPYLSILACENTDWLVNSLKGGIITGGFSRRFIVVLETGRPERAMAFVEMPDNHEEIKQRMVKHLQSLWTTPRDFTWTESGKTYYKKWYQHNFDNVPDDPTMQGFMATKDQQLLKVCMLLDLAEEKPNYQITPDLLETGLAMFSAIEPNMPKLYASSGRNELALPQQKLIELIESRGGVMSEKEVQRMTVKDMSPSEQFNSIRWLVETETLVKHLMSYPDEKSAKRIYLISASGMKNEKVKLALLKKT